MTQPGPTHDDVPPTARSIPPVWLVWGAAVALLAAAWLTGTAAWGILGLAILLSVACMKPLRQGSRPVWLAWTALMAALAWLALSGHGWHLLALLPAGVNAALCLLFATTLRTPSSLIERIIAAMESPAHAELHDVRRYARRLTAAWALLFGMQAILLCVAHAVIATGVAGPAWLAVLHGYQAFGCHLLVIVFMCAEHRFRRHQLPHVEHRSFAGFMVALVRCWPQVMASRNISAEHGHA